MRSRWLSRVEPGVGSWAGWCRGAGEVGGSAVGGMADHSRTGSVGMKARVGAGGGNTTHAKAAWVDKQVIVFGFCRFCGCVYFIVSLSVHSYRCHV
jgi:hypothetical protein